MQKTLINLSETGSFSKLILDYVDNKSEAGAFYRYPQSIDSFKEAISNKKKEKIDRKLLVDILSQQNKEAAGKFPLVKGNINSLLNENTFTVTTGHQLCMFTGPLYFIYKIITTINLAEQLKLNYPEYTFVPVYWEASEDHDIEEVNHINIFGKKITWEIKAEENSPAGVVNTKSISPVLNELKNVLGDSENAKKLLELFSKAYLEKENLAEATRFIVSELFGKHGLVVINADNKELKNQLIPIIKDDVFNNSNYKLIEKTIEEFNKNNYKAQVSPRKINFFYLKDNTRNRLEEEEGFFKVLNTSITFTKQELEKEIDSNPERFSPNVVTRSLYQEKILPNVAYVGGPGELAYWLEYKAMFEHYNINFPVLWLRNSVLWIDKTSASKLEKLNVPLQNIFKDTNEIVNSYIKENSDSSIDLSAEESMLEAAFKGVADKAEKTDATLKPAVEAELKKSITSLKNLQAKMLKAEKQKQETSLNQIKKIKEKLFPEGNLQERQENFIPFYLLHGEGFFDILKKELDPLEKKFYVFRERF